MKSYNKIIHFPDCTLYHRDSYCTTIFSDGKETSNWPLYEDNFYCEIAKQCGHDNLMDYCYEHEAMHTFVPWKLFGQESYVTTRTARKIKMSMSAAMSEERLVYYFQKYLRDDDFPCIEENWPVLKEEAFSLLFG